MSLVREILEMRRRPEAMARGPWVEGLKRLVQVLRDHAGTNQAGRVARWLGALYFGERSPACLTDLRSVDFEIADAMLATLAFDRLGRELNNFRYGEGGPPTKA